MPDGTLINGKASNLFATFNAKFGANAWQTMIEKAAQTWAAATNINFSVVPDNGASNGSGGYQQGDPSFGDIRIGGYNFGTRPRWPRRYMPPPVNNYSIAGDIAFNTGQSLSSARRTTCTPSPSTRSATRWGSTTAGSPARDVRRRTTGSSRA